MVGFTGGKVCSQISLPTIVPLVYHPIHVFPQSWEIHSLSFPIFRVGRAFKRVNLELHSPLRFSLSLSLSLLFNYPVLFFFAISLFLSFSFSLVFYKQLFYFSPLSYLSINVRRFPLSYSLSFDSLTSRLSTRNPKTGSVCLYLHTRGVFARVRFFWYALPFNASRRIRTHDSRESHAHFRYVAGEYILDAMGRYQTGLSLTGFKWNLQFHFVRINYSVAQLEYIERWMIAVYDYVVDCNCHDTGELRFDIVSKVLWN